MHFPRALWARGGRQGGAHAGGSGQTKQLEGGGSTAGGGASTASFAAARPPRPLPRSLRLMRGVDTAVTLFSLLLQLSLALRWGGGLSGCQLLHQAALVAFRSTALYLALRLPTRAWYRYRYAPAGHRVVGRRGSMQHTCDRPPLQGHAGGATAGSKGIQCEVPDLADRFAHSPALPCSAECCSSLRCASASPLCPANARRRCEGWEGSGGQSSICGFRRSQEFAVRCPRVSCTDDTGSPPFSCSAGR